MTKQEIMQICEELHESQEKFYIQINDPYGIVPDFIKDCNSPIGFHIVSTDAWGIRIMVWRNTACSSIPGWWTLAYGQFISCYSIVRSYISNSLITNKNRKTCFKCNCKTEERRDFSDMSIRLMCPRCKI